MLFVWVFQVPFPRWAYGQICSISELLGCLRNCVCFFFSLPSTAEMVSEVNDIMTLRKSFNIAEGNRVRGSDGIPQAIH